MTELSAFDPSVFLETTYTEAPDTEYTNLPEGTYRCMVEKVTTRVVEVPGDGGTKEQRPVADVTLQVDASEHGDVMKSIGLEEASLRYTLWLDVNPANPNVLTFGPNRNVKLGKFLTSCGINIKKPWNLSMVEGRGPILANVVLDPKEDGAVYNKVVKVTGA